MKPLRPESMLHVSPAESAPGMTVESGSHGEQRISLVHQIDHSSVKQPLRLNIFAFDKVADPVSRIRLHLHPLRKERVEICLFVVNA